MSTSVGKSYGVKNRGIRSQNFSTPIRLIGGKEIELIKQTITMVYGWIVEKK